MIVNKPWGTYKILHTGLDYQVKEICINPYHQISLQSHQKRSEVWTVVSGSGNCIIGIENKKIKIGDTVTIKKEQVHRLSAQESELKIIEVQVEDYDEEDIIRYLDDYNRLDDIKNINFTKQIGYNK